MRHSVCLRIRVLFTALTVGCASQGGPDLSEDAAWVDAVELHVWNRSTRTVNAYAWWGSARVRLGQVPANQRAVFHSPLRAASVSLSWHANSIAQRATRPRCSVAVRDGDRTEWTIASSLRSCSYIRLDPVP